MIYQVQFPHKFLVCGILETVMKRLVSLSLFLFLFSFQTVFASEVSVTNGCVGLNANPIKGATPLTVNFSGQGFEQGKSISQYEFDFGDASGGQLRIVRQNSSAAFHRYYNPGTYTATLKVLTSDGQWVGGAGCSVTITTTAAIQTLPQTGPSENVALLSLILGVAGFYINKHFKRLV